MASILYRSETRVSILTAMTEVLNEISKLPTYVKAINQTQDQNNFKSKLMIDELVDSLECFIDKDNESFCLSKFLKVNAKLLLAPNILLGKFLMRI